MGGALVVIPLAAMVVPIVLVLIAVLIDVIALIWAAYRMWHDEWSIQLGHYIGAHFISPTSRYLRAHGFIG